MCLLCFFSLLLSSHYWCLCVLVVVFDMLFQCVQRVFELFSLLDSRRGAGLRREVSISGFFFGAGSAKLESVIKMVHNGVFTFDFGHFCFWGSSLLGK